MNNNDEFGAAIVLSEAILSKIMPVIGKIIKDDCCHLFEKAHSDDERKNAIGNFLIIANNIFSLLSTAGMFSLLGSIGEWDMNPYKEILENEKWQIMYLNLIKGCLDTAVKRIDTSTEKNQSH